MDARNVIAAAVRCLIQALDARQPFFRRSGNQQDTLGRAIGFRACYREVARVTLAAQVARISVNLIEQNDSRWQRAQRSWRIAARHDQDGTGTRPLNSSLAANF